MLVSQFRRRLMSWSKLQGILKHLYGPTVKAVDVSSTLHHVGCLVSAVNMLTEDPKTFTGEKEFLVKDTGNINDQLSMFIENMDFGGTVDRILIRYNYADGSTEGNSYALRELPVNYKFSRGGAKLKSITFVLNQYSGGKEVTGTFENVMVYRGERLNKYFEIINDFSGCMVERAHEDGSNARTFVADSEGVVTGMTSISPDMKITTLKDGTTLDVSYYAKEGESA